ncbi:MAG: sigma-54-dependent Fis family transcriptional regulator [Deltaproteobacteria bacterium]|nr:sigma-54-dependent Fis family transcriptional regulator [Deltaproteobacteria bacterium]
MDKTPQTKDDQNSEQHGIALSRVLLVDDDDMVLDSLHAWIGAIGVEGQRCRSGAEALEQLTTGSFPVMVTDLMLPDMNGIELMDRARAIQRDIEVVILTSYGSVESAIEAIRAGAFDYLQKPAYAETILHVLRRISRQRSLEHEVEALRTALRRPFHTLDLVARSHQMRHVLELMALAANSQARVLLQGEDGVGKEAVARHLQSLTEDPDGPFQAVHCGSLAPDLLEQELFRHSKDRPGRIQKAHKGVLYLRDVDKLSAHLQIRLLHFLSDQALYDDDGNVVSRPEMRIVSGSMVPIDELVAAGTFREDLYYKLAVVQADILPLRDRTIDVLALSEQFLEEVIQERDVDARYFHRRALAEMMDYPWPGNVPELRQTVLQAALASEGPEIMVEHLPRKIRKHVEGGPLSWQRSLKDLEREHIERVLEGVGWNRSRAADILGIRRMTLYNKIKEFGLNPP